MTGDTDGSSSKRRPSSRYSAFVGLAFIALIVIAAINTFESNEGGVLGADETQVGEPLPELGDKRGGQRVVVVRRVQRQPGDGAVDGVADHGVHQYDRGRPSDV